MLNKICIYRRDAENIQTGAKRLWNGRSTNNSGMKRTMANRHGKHTVYTLRAHDTSAEP